MEKKPKLLLSVSEFITLTNQTLEYAYPLIEVEGEVVSFKINQSKYVFFDIKDEEGSVGCFMMFWQLRVPIEDGLKVIVTASPKLTQWGKFSLTVRSVRFSGEGSIKKAFELLRIRMEKEGLFAVERKRILPRFPHHVGVISSVQAAGYADFMKILNDRWGGVKVKVANVQVQGVDAPDQIIRALKYFNSQDELPEVIVIVRGGGSVEDLGAFNDELLVREIAMSRIPTIVGVGHEVDVSLADMVADVRAATPSNAAQILVPDRKEIIRGVRSRIRSLLPNVGRVITRQQQEVKSRMSQSLIVIEKELQLRKDTILNVRHLLAEFNPQKILQRGYALIRGQLVVGSIIEIEKSDIMLRAEVQDVKRK